MKSKYSVVAALLVLSSCSNDVQNIYSELPKSKDNVEKITEIKDGEVQLYEVNEIDNPNFFIAIGKLPKKNSVDYFTVTEKNEDGKRRAVIDGLIIEISDSSATHIHLRENLDEVEINAEELIITKPLHFPGASLTINAKKLVFKQDGFLSVKPNKILDIALPTKDGAVGKSAGTIVLNVDKLEFEGDRKRIDASGGDGQDAGFGIPGKSGKDVVPFHGNVVSVCTTTITECYQKEVGVVEVRRSAPECVTNIPGNGEKGTAAGMPGSGGFGGVIESKLGVDLQKYSFVHKGAYGKAAPVTLGGAGGNPKEYYREYKVKKVQTSCSGGGGGVRLTQRLSLKSNSDYRIEKLGSTKSGEDTPSPYKNNLNTYDGHVSKIKVDLNKVNENNLLAKIEYAKDLYRNNYFTLAQAELEELTKVQTTNIINEIIISEGAQLLNQIKSHKDINGLALNHVPVLSLPKIFESYRNEIENSFNTLKFTAYFSNKIAKSKEVSEKILQEKESFGKEVDSLYEQNLQANKALSEATKLSYEIEASFLAFETELKKVEAEIEDEARKNVESREKKRKLLGTIKLVANLAKVFPAGQPLAGVIGTGIDSIVNMSQKDDLSWTDAIKDGYEIYQDLSEKINSKTVKESKDHWNSNYAKLSYEKFKAKSRDMDENEFKDYLKEMAKLAKPLAKPVSDYYKNTIAKQVPRTEYNAEVEKIKAEHPRFKMVIAKLNDLQEKKQKFDDLINKNMAMMTSAQTNIYKAFTAIQVAESNVNNHVSGLNYEVSDTLKMFESNAKNRLQDYKNLLVKAYQYRLLEPYTGDLNLEKLDNQLRKFVESTDEEIDLEQLKQVYYADLSSVTNGIFNIVNSGDAIEYETSVSYELNSSELEALESSGTIYLNPKVKNLINDGEENLRVLSVAVDDISVQTEKENSYVDVEVSQVGSMVIQKSGKNYVFFQDGQNVKWSTRYDAYTNELREIQESKSIQNLFDVVERTHSNSKLYADPGLVANYQIKLKGKVSELNRLRMTFRYSYSIK